MFSFQSTTFFKKEDAEYVTGRPVENFGHGGNVQKMRSDRTSGLGRRGIHNTGI
jgi:hypothetical protein